MDTYDNSNNVTWESTLIFPKNRNSLKIGKICFTLPFEKHEHVLHF